MIKQMLTGAAFVGLVACSSPEEMGDDVGVTPPETPAVADGSAPNPPAPPEPDESEAVRYENNAEDNGATREFSYVWPKEVSAIPALASELTGQRDKDLAEQKKWWAESLADCPEDSVSCRSNSFELTWEVVTDLPNYLSLSSSLYTYSGGAHGNYGRTATVWDREAEALIETKKMFVSLDALYVAISVSACAALNKERAKRRGEETFGDAGEWPNQCVSMEETVLFLGSSSGEKFDRLGVYYAPYIAGPYAEGDFEFTLPVTQAVISAVKPEYRGAFSLGKQ